jgi:hypothetical protein
MRLLVIVGGLALAGAQARELAKLVPEADAIVLGMSSVADVSETSARFTIDVEKVFAGGVEAGTKVDVDCSPDLKLVPTSPVTGSIAVRGIWFLTKGSGGTWGCLLAGMTSNMVQFPDLPLPAPTGDLPASLAYSESAPLIDRLTLEVGASHPRVPAIILNALYGLNSTAAMRVLHYLESSGDANYKLLGIAGLLGRNDTQAVLELEKIQDQIVSIRDSQGLPGDALWGSFRSTDPVAVAALGRIATSWKGHEMLRRGAAAALAAIHTADAVPWLGKLLDNPNQELQIWGAQGLSFFANGTAVGQGGPAMDYLKQSGAATYRTEETEKHLGINRRDPAEGLVFWREWWGSHAELHGKP